LSDLSSPLTSSEVDIVCREGVMITSIEFTRLPPERLGVFNLLKDNVDYFIDFRKVGTKLYSIRTFLK
jgi:hypothetical protein